MNRSRLFRTTAIRLSLRYALFYAVLTGLGLGILYWATSRYVDAQIVAGLEHELSTLVKIDQQQGRAKLEQIIAREPAVYTENQRYLLLLDPTGNKKLGGLKGWPDTLETDATVRNIWIDHSLIPVELEDKDGFWPMIATTLDDGSQLLVAQSVRQAENLQEFILSAMSIILLISVGLALALGYRLGRQMLQRVDLINETARQVRQGNLSIRVPRSGNNDEYDEVATHLNRMLNHLQQLLQDMQEVTDNVAHDLRSPLSRLKNRLEVTLLETRDKQAYQQTLQQAVSDVDSMIKTFNSLLEIAQAESGSYRGEWSKLDLSALVSDLGELYEGVAEQNQQHLIVRVAPDRTLSGNQYLLSQAISNLLENAIKYAGQESRIMVELIATEATLTLRVSDNGRGIPDADLEHVLKRFVRLERARSSQGNGLGLSLVAAVARLHNARLVLYNNAPGLAVEINFNLET